MDFEQWLMYGQEQGFCSRPVCATHDGLPVADEEEELAWEEGSDPCVPAVRLLD